ncbi:MAG: SDR family oxidoreductase [Chloroflexota bacterium]
MSRNGSSTNGTKKSRGAIVVTGTSTGIGRATADRLAAAGFHVFAGVRKLEDAKPGANITPIVLDVTDQSTIDAAAATVTKQLGDSPLRGLVNNAGISVAGPIEFVPLDDFRRQLEVNVIGQVAVTQAFLPLLRKSRGRIVNVGSIGGKMASPFLGPYAASKFALEAITDALRGELRPWHIAVSIVEPGAIATPLWERSRVSATSMLANAPVEATELYGEAIDAMLAAVDVIENRAIPADAVAKAIEHALTAKRPKTRYLVGIAARAQSILAGVVPDQAMDGLIAWQLKLPKKGSKAVKKSAPECQPEDSRA